MFTGKYKMNFYVIFRWMSCVRGRNKIRSQNWPLKSKHHIDLKPCENNRSLNVNGQWEWHQKRDDIWVICYTKRSNSYAERFDLQIWRDARYFGDRIVGGKTILPQRNINFVGGFGLDSFAYSLWIRRSSGNLHSTEFLYLLFSRHKCVCYCVFMVRLHENCHVVSLKAT
jgi:hypothetical protein